MNDTSRFEEHPRGALGAKVERLMADVEGLGEHMDTLRHQATFVQGTMWVVGPLLLALIGGVSWIIHAIVTGAVSVTVAPK